jgi:hypothetical protein
MLLFHWLRHDCGQAPGELSLATSCLDRTRDCGCLCHGADITQPSLSLQPPRLLGSVQQPLYIQGMTYGERLEKAIKYAQLNQRQLAERVAEILAANQIKKPIAQQQVSRALKSASSEYTLWFAKACQVNAEWLEKGIGEMITTDVASISHWPFQSVDELRYLRLKPADKQKIEGIVVTLIEAFEADAGLRPKKGKRKHK